MFQGSKKQKAMSERILVLMIGLFASPAFAFNYHELEVYPFQTEAPGIWEVENFALFSNGFQPGYGSAIVRDTLEINAGVMDGVEVALYNDFERLAGDVMKYKNTRLRTHLSFFEKGELPIDIGAYFELGLPHDDQVQWELESKLILEKDWGRFTFTLNPIVELENEKETKILAGGEVEHETETEIEKAYAVAVAYRYSSTVLPKLSYFDELAEADKRVTLLYPTVDFRLIPHWEIGFGAGFGLSKAAEKRLINTKIEYEF